MGSSVDFVFFLTFVRKIALYDNTHDKPEVKSMHLWYTSKQGFDFTLQNVAKTKVEEHHCCELGAQCCKGLLWRGAALFALLFLCLSVIHFQHPLHASLILCPGF